MDVEVHNLDTALHNQIMMSTLVYSKRAHYAHKELDMAALIYLSDKPFDLGNLSDWRIQLMRDTSKYFTLNQAIPIVWSKWDDEQLKGTSD